LNIKVLLSGFLSELLLLKLYALIALS